MRQFREKTIQDLASEVAPVTSDRGIGVSLDDLARRVCDAIDSAESARSVREERWAELKKLLRHDAGEREPKPFKGACESHYNVIQVKIGALRTLLCGTILSRDPHCVATCGGPVDYSGIAERVTQFFANRAGVAMAVRKVSGTTCWSNRGIIRATFKENISAYNTIGGPGFELEIVQPEDFVAYPASLVDMQHMRVVGHRFYRMRSEINQLIESGFYLRPDKPLSNTDPSTTRLEGAQYPAGFTPSVDADVTDDETIECYDTLVKVDYDGTGEKWWNVVVVKSDEVVLRVTPYPYTYCWYVPFSIKIDDDGGFYPSESIAHDLQQLQKDINHLYQLFIDGVNRNVNAAWVGPPLDEQMFSEVAPASYTPIWGETEQIKRLTDEVRLDYLPSVIGALESRADAILRISALRQGSALSKTSSATEASLVAQGDQGSVDEYVNSFGMGLEALYSLIWQMACAHIDTWYDAYGEKLGIDRQELEYAASSSMRWDLHVRTVGATPQGRLDALRLAMSVAVSSPQASFDIYKLGGAILAELERLGLPGAQKYQLPEQPMQLAVEMLKRAGLPEDVAMQGAPMLIGAVQEMVEQIVGTSQENQQDEPQATNQYPGNGSVGGLDDISGLSPRTTGITQTEPDESYPGGG